MDDFIQEVKDVFSYLVDDGIVTISLFDNRISNRINITFMIDMCVCVGVCVCLDKVKRDHTVSLPLLTKAPYSDSLSNYNIESFGYEFIPDILNCLDLLSINRSFYHATFITSIINNSISYSIILKLDAKDSSTYILKEKLVQIG